MSERPSNIIAFPKKPRAEVEEKSPEQLEKIAVARETFDLTYDTITELRADLEYMRDSCNHIRSREHSVIDIGFLPRKTSGARIHLAAGVRPRTTESDTKTRMPLITADLLTHTDDMALQTTLLQEALSISDVATAAVLIGSFNDALLKLITTVNKLIDENYEVLTAPGPRFLTSQPLENAPMVQNTDLKQNRPNAWLRDLTQQLEYTISVLTAAEHTLPRAKQILFDKSRS